VHACDHDTGALAWARRNGATFGFAVHEGDWFDALPPALEGKLDLVVAHLPYVPTTAVRLLPRDFRDHEPRHTVDGGADGLDPFRVVAAGCRRWLAADGVLLTLVGQEQAATVLAFAADHRLGVELAPADEATGDSVVVSLRRSTGKPA
jgi:release factor glutamine methyltransferase